MRAGRRRRGSERRRRRFACRPCKGGHVVRAEAEAEALEKRRAECAVKLQALGAAPRGSRREVAPR